MTRTGPAFGQWWLSLGGGFLYRDDAPGERRWLREDARRLGLEVTCLRCPVGILLDRLDEYPEECDAPPEVVAEAVRQLRERNPLGTETNW